MVASCGSTAGGNECFGQELRKRYLIPKAIPPHLISAPESLNLAARSVGDRGLRFRVCVLGFHARTYGCEVSHLPDAGPRLTMSWGLGLVLPFGGLDKG